MKMSYYPGCTLKTKARNLDESAQAAMQVLGVELEELPRWNCCGAVFNLADDDLIHFVAPVRDLIRVMDQGSDKVIVTCSMCYNTLARANLIMGENEEKRDTLNAFMEEEEDYHGEVEVVHLLSFLKNEIGWDKVREAVKTPLAGLKLAAYYGCTLLRPTEVAIEAPNTAAVFEELIAALGAEPVRFPGREECCGAYQILSNPGAAKASVTKIVEGASRWGADAIVTSCPLCEYNVGKRQADMLGEESASKGLPTFYFTQLLAVALGLDSAVCHFELSPDSSRLLLEAKSYLAQSAA